MDIVSGVAPRAADHTASDNRTGLEDITMCTESGLEIVALAVRIDPDRSAVREWFFETPLRTHGKTACELVQAGRSDVVVAFLEGILRDAGDEADDVRTMPDAERIASRET